MRVLTTRSASRDGRAVYLADVEVADGIKLFGLRVERRQDGFRVFAPNAAGRATATFGQDAVKEIARAVIAHGEGERYADGRS